MKFKAVAIRWESDEFPGWIEVAIRDAAGHEHHVIEKVPVITLLNIRADSQFPIELWLDAEAETASGDDVTVTLPHLMETTDGKTRLTLSAADVESA